MSAQIVVCCGSGGVGKTSTSAALGLALAQSGQRVALLTIDPAKRLADSLNLGAIGGTPTRVPLQGGSGSCDALMLDVEETFEALIRRVATSEASAERILNNRYFQFASTRLGGVHEYMAAEKVRELALSSAYDWVVVDTPPARNALDFLRAPERIAGLMDGGVVRWMAMPATGSGWRALELGSEAVARVLRRLVGQGTIGEIAEFFELFRDLWEGFHTRSKELQQLLSSERTRFFLITSPAPTARSEALFFLEQLTEFQVPFGGFIINRVELAPQHSDDVAPHLSQDLPQSLFDAVSMIPAMQRLTADEHTKSIQSLLAAGPAGAPHWLVPDLGRPINKLDDLLELASHLPAPSDT